MKHSWRRRLGLLLALILCMPALTAAPVHAEGAETLDIPLGSSFDDTLGGTVGGIMGGSIWPEIGHAGDAPGDSGPDSYSAPYIGGDDSLGMEGEVIYPENSESAAVSTDAALAASRDDAAPEFSAKGAKLSASRTSVSLKKGETATVTMSVSGVSGTIQLNFGTNNDYAISPGWGDWYESGGYWKAPLRITGSEVGQGTITVNLVQMETGQVLGTVYISVNVTSPSKPRVEVSRNSLSLAEGAGTQIIVSLIDAYNASSVAFGTSNDSVVSCEWGDWVDSNIPLKITGRSPGSATITITLWDANDREIARAYVSVSVYRKDNPKISLSTSSISLKTGNSRTISATCSGYSGEYYMEYGTSGGNAFNVQWVSWDSYDSPAYMTVTGTNPGSGSVTIYMKDNSGRVLASGTVSVSVAANGSPKVTVSTRSVSMAAGTTERITIGYENLYENAQLTISSDNEDVVTCEFTGDWYGNRHDILLRAQKPGNATVYIIMTRSSDGATLSHAQISVTTSGFAIQDVGFGFHNYSENISLDLCKYMFGNNLQARQVFEADIGNGGVCYGMASGAALIIDSVYPDVDTFNSRKSVISKLSKNDRSSNLGLSVTDFIEAMHISQIVTQKRTGLSTLVSTVIRETDAGRMVLILMRGEYDGGDAGHAVLAFGYRQVSDREIAIRIYDSNHVTSSSSMQETTLTVTRNSAGGNYTSWSYPSLGWGTGRRYNSIGYTTLSDIQSVWNQRGSLGNDNMNLFSTNEDSFSMYDFTGRLVLQYEDGVIVQRSADIIELELSNVLPGGGTADVPNMFYAPIDLYTVVDGTPETPMEISMSDLEMAIELSTGADRFDLCADDYSRIANVIMTPVAGDEYSVKLLSTLSGSLEEISLEGMGTGAPISIALENGELSILGAESADLSITMPEDEYFIEAQAETGGTVTPEGITAYAPGENIMYTISADEGYRIGAVYVDGEDVGPVDSYCFENISRSHTIYAVFVRSMNRFTVAPAANEYSFTGAEIRPAIEVADAEGNMLTEGVDYTVSYGNNTDIGTATVYAIAVPGSGYYGSAMATFEIVHGETRFISADAGADGTVSLVFDHTGDITVVLAAYGADGSMIEAAAEHVSAGVNTAQITLSAAAMNGADRIKAFMADGDFRPLCRPIEINIP